MNNLTAKISIQPAFPMFQWWEYIPEYDLTKLWKKTAIELEIGHVKAIYKRGNSYLFDVQRPDVQFPLYLASVPAQLSHISVQELSPLETLKFLKKYKSKAPMTSLKILGILFLIIVMVRMFVGMHFSG